MGGALLYLLVGVALFPRWTVDDAYITYRYAENLARHGEFVFNTGEDPVEGYTGVLLPVAIAGAVSLGIDADTASKAIGVASLLASALLLYAALATAGVRPWLGGVVVAVYAATPCLLTHALGGLETMLFCALVLACVWTLMRAVDTRDDGRALSIHLVLALLVCLARPEGAALAAPSLCALAFVNARRGRREFGRFAMLTVALFVVPAAAYFAWRWWYYGQLMPNTYYAKWHWRVNTDSLRLAISFAAYSLAFPGAAALAVGLTAPSAFLARVVATRANVRWAFGVSLVFFGLVLAQYARSALIMNFSHRFYVPFLGLGLLLAGVIAEAAFSALSNTATGDSSASWRTRCAVAAACGLLAVQGAVDARLLGSEIAFARGTMALLADEHMQVAALLRQRVPANEWVIVVVDSGAIPYFAGCRTVDFGGLNDEFIGRRFYNAHPETRIVDYFYTFHAGAVVVTSTRPDRIEGPEPTKVFDDPRFEDYVRVACFGSAAYPNYYQFVYLRSDLAAATGATNDGPTQSPPIKATTSSNTSPFVESASGAMCVAAPAQSVNVPPASTTIGANAAVSHRFMIGSSMTSARPVATRTWP